MRRQGSGGLGSSDRCGARVGRGESDICGHHWYRGCLRWTIHLLHLLYLHFSHPFQAVSHVSQLTLISGMLRSDVLSRLHVLIEPSWIDA